MKKALLWGVVIVCLLLNIYKAYHAYENGMLREITNEISSFFN